MTIPLVKLDYGFCTSQGLGDQAGIDPQGMAAWQETMAQAHQSVVAQRSAAKLGFLELTEMGDNGLAPILAEAQRLQGLADTVVVLGIGGSALGATCVDMAINGVARNSFARTGGMRLLVADNPDPRSFGQLLDGVDLKRTVFNVISKSGSTAETMSQYLVVRGLLEKELGRDEALKRLTFITDPEKGNLRIIEKSDPVVCLSVPPNVGGRFSVLSAVGLLPLACAGVDIKALINGARDMARRCAGDKLLDNPAYLFAALAIDMWRKGRNVLVMMPYASDLFGLSQWFGQLWAESLGKAHALNGDVVHLGQTPVAAVGATDQHSQLQLYMEGPQDKLVCLITVDDYGREIEIPGLHPDIDSIAYLGGRSMAELIAAEAKATAVALAQQGRPSLSIRLPRIDEHALGQVLLMLELATVAAGAVLKINPLDQPGVELGKGLTYGLMGRPGYEDQAKSMQQSELGDEFLV